MNVTESMARSASEGGAGFFDGGQAVAGSGDVSGDPQHIELVSFESARVVIQDCDLGANVDCSAEQLHEFAVMGTVLVSALRHIER